MKETPILFSAPMVRAILEGRKTQTRRVVTVPGGYKPLVFDFDKAWLDGGSAFGPVYLKVSVMHPEDGPDGRIVRVHPRWKAGDRLWVRETFYCNSGFYPGVPPDGSEKVSDDHGKTWRYPTFQEKRQAMLDDTIYRADFPDGEFDYEDGRARWVPSIHMPRWVCRIWLEVVSVRVERVQDISEEDAKAEGVAIDKGNAYHVAGYEGVWAHATARGCFETLWDSLNAKRGYGWKENPWVWVVEFKRATGGRQ